MKTTIKILIMLAILDLFALASCSKDRIEDKKTTSSDYASMDDFYNENQPEEQNFVVDSVAGDTIRGKYGAKIWGAPKNIYMKKSDHSDIFYPYKLKLIETYKIKDKIFAKQTDISGGNLLQSSGDAKVTAFKDNDELVLKEHCGLNMIEPASSPTTGMQLYYGFTTGTTNNWDNNVLNTGYLFSNDDVTSISNISYGYNTRIAQLGWNNIAKLFSATSKTIVSFSLSGTNTNTNFIDVFLIFKNNNNAVIKVSSFSANNIPVGENVTVLAYGKKSDGTMMYCKKDITVTSSMTIPLDLISTTKADLVTLMNSL